MVGVAGAQRTPTRGWPVDGEATADLMKAYYEALARGGGRSEAMRGVQLAMLHDERWAHPYYWAAFIVSGDDRSLDDKAVAPDLRVRGARGCSCDLSSTTRDGISPAWLASALAALLLAARRRGATNHARTQRPCHAPTGPR